MRDDPIPFRRKETSGWYRGRREENRGENIENKE